MDAEATGAATPCAKRARLEAAADAVADGEVASEAPPRPIYLDYNATSPLLPEVLSAMLPCFTVDFGNPSSSHTYGSRASAAVRRAREQVARAINAEPGEVIFVSGGSESINYAIKGAAVAQQLQLRGNHIVTSQAEHTCVLETVRFLEANGFRATYLPVDEHGRVSPQELAAAITDKTVVVSIMHANNEIGTLQPIRELVAAAKAANPNVLFHTDAAQSVAKVRVDVREMGVDYLTVAGHKLYAPKGVGALFIRKGTPPLQKMVHGACHEFNLRAGTENVASIVGFGTACELGSSRLEENFKHLQRLRDRLLAELRAGLGREAEALLRVNGHPELRLPNTLSVSFKNIRGSELQRALRHRVACSGGAACNDGKESKSHVLRAIRLADAYAFGTLRLSVGLPTTEADVIEAARALAAEVLRLHARNEKAAAESGLLFPLSPSSSSTSSGAASAQSPLSAPAPPPPPRKGDAEAAH